MTWLLIAVLVTGQSVTGQFKTEEECKQISLAISEAVFHSACVPQGKITRM